MARIRSNFQSGSLTAQLDNVSTTFFSAELAAFPVVTAPDFATVVLDPNGEHGTPEIVYITAHALNATSATITRAQETSFSGGPARVHVLGTHWIDGLTVGEIVGFISGAANNTFTGTQTFNAGSTTTVGIIAKAIASQSSNLQEWQDSSGTILSRIATNGNIYGNAVYDGGARVYSPTNPVPDNPAYVHIANTETITGTKTFSGTVNYTGVTQIGSSTSGTLNIGDGTVTKTSGNAFSYSAGLAPPFIAITGYSTVSASSATVVPSTILGAVSQSASLTEWKNSGGTVLSRVDPSGYFYEGVNRVYSAGNANLGTSVVAASAWGTASSVGVSTAYAHADHFHGTMATPVTSAIATSGISISSSTGAITIGNTGVLSLIPGTNISVTSGTGNITVSAPAFGSTVVSETGWGVASAVGTSGLLAQADHTHGSPPVPVTAITPGPGLSASGATGAVTLTNTGVTSNVGGTGISITNATGASTITNTGVTSALAGTGIGVSSGTGAVTFSNTGVTSVIAGLNANVSNGTGTVTVGTIASPSFTNVSASGTITGTGGVYDGAVRVYSSNNPPPGGANSVTTNTVQTITSTKTFQAFSAASVPIIVQGAASQTGNLLEFRDSNNTLLGRVDYAGYFYTGTTQLGSGAAGGTGVTQIIAGTGISVNSGTGAVTVTNSGVTSIVAGTNVTISNASGAVTINASAAAPSNMMTLDTIQNVTAAKTFIANSATFVPAIFQGAASQTADLSLWQDSTSTTVARVSASGQIFEGANRVYSAGNVPPYPVTSVHGRTGAITATAADIGAGTFAGAFTFNTTVIAPSVTAPAASAFNIIVGGRNAISSNTAGTEIIANIPSQTADSVQITDSALSLLTKFDNFGRLGIGFGTTTLTSSIASMALAAGQQAIIARGAASQTANIQEWQNSSGTVLSRVANDGTIWVGTTQLGAGGTGSGNAADSEIMGYMGVF